ncbi:hypothetical protein Tco_0390117 [Tanacetum coccineum]
MPSSPSLEPTIGYFDDMDFLKDFENEFQSIVYNDQNSKSDPLNEPSVDGYDKGIIHSYEQRLETIWGRPINRVHVLDFAGLTDGMRQTLRDRLSMVYAGDDDEALFTSHVWRRLIEVRAPLRQFILAMGLYSEEEMAEPRDFLGPAPSYVHIRDPVRRLCHKMIACSISGRRQGVEKYLFHHAEGRKSGARLSGSHFIGRLAVHFGLVGDQGLRGLSVVVSEILVIDLHKLARLNICVRFGDTWAWIALGPERQQAAAVGAPGAAEEAPAANEGA